MRDCVPKIRAAGTCLVHQISVDAASRGKWRNQQYRQIEERARWSALHYYYYVFPTALVFLFICIQIAGDVQNICSWRLKTPSSRRSLPPFALSCVVIYVQSAFISWPRVIVARRWQVRRGFQWQSSVSQAAVNRRSKDGTGLLPPGGIKHDMTRFEFNYTSDLTPCDTDVILSTLLCACVCVCYSEAVIKPYRVATWRFTSLQILRDVEREKNTTTNLQGLLGWMLPLQGTRVFAFTTQENSRK